MEIKIFLTVLLKWNSFVFLKTMCTTSYAITLPPNIFKWLASAGLTSTIIQRKGESIPTQFASSVLFLWLIQPPIPIPGWMIDKKSLQNTLKDFVLMTGKNWSFLFCILHLGLNWTTQTITSMLSLKMKPSLILPSVSILLHFHLDIDAVDEQKTSVLIFWLLIPTTELSGWKFDDLFIHQCVTYWHVRKGLIFLYHVFFWKIRYGNLSEEYWLALLTARHKSNIYLYMLSRYRRALTISTKLMVYSLSKCKS